MLGSSFAGRSSVRSSVRPRVEELEPRLVLDGSPFYDPAGGVAFDVQLGQTQRSYIRYLDLSETGIGALPASQLRLTNRGLDGSGSTNVPFSLVPMGANQLRLDVGAGGLGGSPTSTVGDGYYLLEADLNGDGVFEANWGFHRLRGDADGDGEVTVWDRDYLNMAAVGLIPVTPIGEADMNANGILSGGDSVQAALSLGRRLATGLPVTEWASLQVEQGLPYRTHITRLDLTINPAIAATANPPGFANGVVKRLKLTGYGDSGGGPGVDVPLTGGVVSVAGNVVTMNFGPNGISGAGRGSSIGDGIYVLRADLDGDGLLESRYTFYRLRGDFNGDGKVTAADAAKVQQLVATGTDGFYADVNGDGNANAADASLVASTLVGAAINPVYPLTDYARFAVPAVLPGDPQQRSLMQQVTLTFTGPYSASTFAGGAGLDLVQYTTSGTLPVVVPLSGPGVVSVAGNVLTVDLGAAFGTGARGAPEGYYSLRANLSGPLAPGMDTEFRFFVLTGDCTGDGVVSNPDIAKEADWVLNGTGGIVSDMDGSGTSTAADVTLVAQRAQNRVHVNTGLWLSETIAAPTLVIQNGQYQRSVVNTLRFDVASGAAFNVSQLQLSQYTVDGSFVANINPGFSASVAGNTVTLTFTLPGDGFYVLKVDPTTEYTFFRLQGDTTGSGIATETDEALILSLGAYSPEGDADGNGIITAADVSITAQAVAFRRRIGTRMRFAD
jgi:hypothetical protein